MNMKAKSPLRYPGGKQKQAHTIVNFFPSHIMEIRDVMMRGGNISFAARERFPDAKLWMNDVNQDLANFFKYASYFNKEMLDMINDWMGKYKGKDLFIHCKKTLAAEKANVRDSSYLKMAVSFYIINRLAYSGTLDGGYTDYNYRYRLTDSNLHRLKSLSGFIKPNTMLTSIEYNIVGSAESKYKDDEVLVFLNPPYRNDAMQMYHKSRNHGNLFDYEALAEYVALLPYNYLVVLDDSEYIRNIFGFANIVSLSTLRGENDPNNNRVIPRDMLFISNY